MNLNKHIQERFLESQIPLFVFVAGLSFCVVIRIINIYGMVTGVADWNYFISKRCFGINYVWFCEISLVSFCVLGLLLIFRYKKKIYSISLIVSCVSIATNIAFMKAGMRIGHMDWIKTLEREILSPDTSPYLIAEYKQWYSIHVDRWNEVEKERFEPASGAYLDSAR